MGMKTGSTPTAAPAAVAAPATEPRKIEGKPAASAPRPEVKGQVAMHAIITGYEVASHLAATLAASPEKVRETLHSLASEVAAQIEAYTFRV